MTLEYAFVSDLISPFSEYRVFGFWKLPSCHENWNLTWNLLSRDVSMLCVKTMFFFFFSNVESSSSLWKAVDGAPHIMFMQNISHCVSAVVLPYLICKSFLFRLLFFNSKFSGRWKIARFTLSILSSETEQGIDCSKNVR